MAASMLRLAPPLSSPLCKPAALRLALLSRVALAGKNGLGSSNSLCGAPLVLPKAISPLESSSSPRTRLTVFASKGYKMKTHKASAKRFRVTGRGKIVRRRAGKQHLLAKKNTKRKLRLSKMLQVDRSDYDNVIGALPYLKVNRKAK
ncbi:ribosomal protein L35 [Wolffia australiana]